MFFFQIGRRADVFIQGPDAHGTVSQRHPQPLTAQGISQPEYGRGGYSLSDQNRHVQQAYTAGRIRVSPRIHNRDLYGNATVYVLCVERIYRSIG